MGFLGTKVGIRRVLIKPTSLGATVEFSIAYLSPTGVCHGVMDHSVEGTSNPALQEAIKNLLDQLTQYAEKVHWENMAVSNDLGTKESEEPDGIMEAIRRATEEGDEPG